MTEGNALTHEVQAFWKSRGGLGCWVGTQDLVAKQLEIEAVAGYVQDGMRVLDAGCGNGMTALELARRYRIDVLGIDFAEEMITAATRLLAEQRHHLKGSVRFEVGEIGTWTPPAQAFDLIYTERLLINLPDWPAQRGAVGRLTEWLAVGGRYVMCENSQDGLDRINGLRAQVGLAAIIPPWHNRYLRDEEVKNAGLPGVVLEGVNDYSSTYYLLSRVVNAALAAQEGKEPDYDSPINRLALRLPSIGNLGQGRIWLWRKTS